MVLAAHKQLHFRNQDSPRPGVPLQNILVQLLERQLFVESRKQWHQSSLQGLRSGILESISGFEVNLKTLGRIPHPAAVQRRRAAYLRPVHKLHQEPY